MLKQFSMISNQLSIINKQVSGQSQLKKVLMQEPPEKLRNYTHGLVIFQTSNWELSVDLLHLINFFLSPNMWLDTLTHTETKVNSVELSLPIQRGTRLRLIQTHVSTHFKTSRGQIPTEYHRYVYSVLISINIIACNMFY